jgi:3-oxoacyl-[acyl-carrier-protein] synthase II
MKASRRVVITGLSVISPLGCDLGTFWHLLSQGSSGVAPITSFDTSPRTSFPASKFDGWAASHILP